MVADGKAAGRIRARARREMSPGRSSPAPADSPATELPEPPAERFFTSRKLECSFRPPSGTSRRPIRPSKFLRARYHCRSRRSAASTRFDPGRLRFTRTEDGPSRPGIRRPRRSCGTCRTQCPRERPPSGKRPPPDRGAHRQDHRAFAEGRMRTPRCGGGRTIGSSSRRRREHGRRLRTTGHRAVHDPPIRPAPRQPDRGRWIGVLDFAPRAAHRCRRARRDGARTMDRSASAPPSRPPLPASTTRRSEDDGSERFRPPEPPAVASEHDEPERGRWIEALPRRCPEVPPFALDPRRGRKDGGGGDRQAEALVARRPRWGCRRTKP